MEKYKRDSVGLDLIDLAPISPVLPSKQSTSALAIIIDAITSHYVHT